MEKQTQPYALRLADDLENYGEFQSYFDEVAAELRRLHEENESLKLELMEVNWVLDDLSH